MSLSGISESYQAYLNSDHWKEVRANAHRTVKACIITGEPSFHLHHLSYRNMGKEKLWLDLIPLSPSLHHDFHIYAKKHGLENFEILEWLSAAGYAVKPEVYEILRRAEAHWRDNVQWIATKRCRPKTSPATKPQKAKKKKRRRGFAYANKPTAAKRKQWRDKTWVKLPKSEAA